MEDDTKTWVILVIACVGFCMFLDMTSALYFNGIPQTHKGEVIYVAQKYNKWCGYKYTDIEVLTYSGDSHHIQFWGHIDFDLGKIYKIHTINECRLFLNAGWTTNEKVVELIAIES